MNHFETPNRISTQNRPILLFFFLSGFCSLAYQVIWMRLAYASFGVTTPVMSVVVSVFMLGLGLGSWWGGQAASELKDGTGRYSLWAYGAVEAVTALGAWAVPHLFKMGEMFLMNMGAMDSGPYLAASAGVLAVTLLPWTIAMGATVPLVLQFLKERKSGTSGFSALYLANVLGAMTGVVSTAFVLIEILGFTHVLLLAALVNLVLAFSAWFWSFHLDAGQTNAVTEETRVAPKGRFPYWAGMVLFGTGFISMAAEVAWFRSFTFRLGNQIYAYASLLTVYLAATTLGSICYRRWIERGRSIPMGTFLPLLVLAGLLPLAAGDMRLNPNVWTILLSIVPFCALLGFQTPGIIDQSALGDPKIAGRLYAMNTAGCIFGPLAVSYGLLPWVGESKTLLFLAAISVMMVLFTKADYFSFPGKKWAVAFSVACVAAFSGFHTFSDYASKYSRNYELRRDSTATVIAIGTGMNKLLLVNGIGLTCLTTTTKVMAHLPSVCLPHPPRKALVICFGMGTTFRSFTTWGIPVDAVELVPSVKECFGFYHADASEVLSRPGARVVVDDGRRFLARTREIYDVVTIDPPPPLEASGSSMLYSREFCELVKSHLSQEGILAQWVPEGEEAIRLSVEKTLRQVFPYVRVFESTVYVGGKHFLASKSPIILPEPKEAARRMGEASRRDLLEWGEVRDIPRYFANVYFHELPDQTEKAVVITDDMPFNEYFLLRRYVLPRFASRIY